MEIGRNGRLTPEALRSVRDYRDGKRSLGAFAAELGSPLTEAIDLLADLGVRSPMEYDDYLRGYAAARGVLGVVAEDRGADSSGS